MDYDDEYPDEHDDLAEEYGENLYRTYVRDDSERRNPFTALSLPLLVALDTVITYYLDNYDPEGKTDTENGAFISVSNIAIDAGELIIRAMDEYGNTVLVPDLMDDIAEHLDEG